MTTRIIGDIHGKLYDYEILLTGQEKSIQVGDFGIGFAGQYWHDKVNDMHRDTGHRFIRGNHDNPGKCPEMVGYIPDMTVEGETMFMFLGGALSIDWGSRMDGVNWWSQTEELSPRELYDAIEQYEKVKTRVMITHDCPHDVATKMFFDTGLAPSGRQYSTRTGSALQTMIEIHQPEFWFFGHWHFTRELDYNGTHFHCLGELDFVDFDFDKMDYA